jgi:hypothetical protein
MPPVRRKIMTVIEGWEVFTEDEAIEAALDKFGKDPMTSVAACALAADDGGKPPEFRFWFDLFLKLENAAQGGGRKLRLLPQRRTSSNQVMR